MLSAILCRCSDYAIYTDSSALNTKTFSALLFQLVKTCCSKLFTQETLMLLFYIYKESQSSLSNWVWREKCIYLNFYPGTCRQVDKKTFFISAIYRCTRPEVFCKKDVLKNFAEFIGKQLCRSLFFKKVASLTYNLIEKVTLTQVIFCEFCKFFEFTVFYGTPLVAA